MRAPAERRRAIGGLLVVGVVLTACGEDPAPPATDDAAALPTGADPVDLDPDDFTADITNRWWPMAVGDRWVYEETDADGTVQRVEVTVLDEIRTVAMGIEARAVHDLVTADGVTVEDTLDWYAQDTDGDVWYLGEETAEYEDGRLVSTEGSWEAGVDGAQPGIAVPADPEPGTGYRQEYLADEAEDEAVVLSFSDRWRYRPAGTPTPCSRGTPPRSSPGSRS
jgi:hypothetical protein